ncbi:MAG: DNA mismatch endonuclease Vsr [Leptolyngbya sp. PLA2]|nr:DNA mismatch endonuclease Vsr [Leptolyngbya sp. PL-A2]MCQ3940071.1 very short patch repair endonuclease [cyanobacterium CYA1]MDL1904192.1 DNA mismatch endonuclease Vsr [Synechococcales cyanobacterium CNB]
MPCRRCWHARLQGLSTRDSLDNGNDAVGDSLSRADRSALMRRIRSKDTGPERIVRSCIHRLGLRFRLHDSQLPGSPDIVLPRLRTVVFVHGCFWHRHPRCRFAYMPKSHTQFWREKFRSNRLRDRRNQAALGRLGWRVLILWECETRDIVALSDRLRRDLMLRRQ